MYISLYNIPPHHYMPKASKQAKRRQDRVSHARSVKLYQPRLASPTVGAGPNPGSAASTPPVSSSGSDIEPADIDANNQSNVNSIASSSDAIVILDSSDAG